MGIQGLTSLINSNERIYLEERFRGKRLVIDGQNLSYLLYYGSGLDTLHGGEYAAFEELIQRFLKALEDCEISPFFLFDGGPDVTQKKDETLRSRVEDRILKAHRAAKESIQERVLPQFTKYVFKQTLVRLEVPMAVCYGEADQEIAALAKEWECPVLSDDSDFYIFDLPGGLLPISHFQWEKVQGSGAQCFIPCKLYRSTSFCSHFEIKPQLLPAFAVLAGNDYVKLEKIGLPVNWAIFNKVGGAQPHHLGLLCWLKRFQRPVQAFEAVPGLGKLTKEGKAVVRKCLEEGMKEYELHPSSLKEFFIHKVVPPFQEMSTCPVPDWALLPLTKARLTTDILDVLLHRNAPLGSPVDVAEKPSANRTSRPIRQVIYHLLLGGGEGIQVLESDRHRLQLKEFPVKPAASGAALNLQLQTLDKEEESVRLQVLLETLGVSEDSLTTLHPQLRLLVAATCYWLKRAEPSPDETLLKALLLGVSHRDTLRKRAEEQNSQQKLDIDVSHAFNQWQGCLKQGVDLNQLLGHPLPEPQIARCYEGSLVHKLVHMMKEGQNLQEFEDDEYRDMLAITQSFVCHDNLESPTWTTVTRGRRGRRCRLEQCC